jgi:NADPH-dependent 2,4-dienoyl-CoA reductase/sulfur reductase-like enzyme
MSAAMYLSHRGHQVTLAEKKDHLGGQFALAWQAPGKETMKQGLEAMEQAIKTNGVSLLMETMIDPAKVKEIHPDLMVWATGAVQNIPDIQGLDSQYTLTSLEFFEGEKEIRGPRILVIGAGRVGLEIAEKLGRQGYDVVATKRTDPIGSMMELITKNLALKRIGEMKNIILMPHTTVKGFKEKTVDIEQDGARMSLEPFDTVILASGMLSAPGPSKEIEETVSRIEVIGDANDVQDIFSAVKAGYQLALSY